MKRSCFLFRIPDHLPEVFLSGFVLSILFSKAKGASKEDLEKVVKMIEIMRGDTDGGYYI